MRVNLSKIRMWVVALCCAAALPLVAQAEELAGTVSFVIGDAVAKTDKATGRTIARGEKILAGDVIETGANGHVHLKMIDGAFVSIRPQSRFRIEEYRYDVAQPRNSRIKFVLEQGTARSITGKAGEASKESYRLNTPLAAIGIRGTDFVVQTERDVTRVVVQSGAIVMTPLSDECLSTTFGPCNTATARVLTAAMRDAFLELKGRKDAPTLVPTEKSLSSPNLIAPPRPEEPAPDRSPKATTPPVSAATPQDTSQAVSTVTIKTQIDTFVAQKAAEVKPDPVKPDPVKPTDPVIPEPVVAAKIWWGRWEGSSKNDGQTLNSALAPDREVTMSNALFGMLRERGETFVPDNGVAKFKLAESESYFMTPDKVLTTGTISNPSLTVDFGNRRYETALTVNVAGISPTEIKSSGEVTFQGIFMSETNSPDTVVAGTLSKNSDQAGYLFQRYITGGSIIGATRWITK